MKRPKIALRLLPCLLLALVPSAYADEGAQKVLACMHTNVPPSLRVQRIELTTTDRQGNSRTLVGRLFAGSNAKGQLRTLLRLDKPADLSGASYLVVQSEDYLRDGMYVYLPSVRRVRRVSGTFADGSLLGTHFSYNDFRQLQTAFSDAKVTLLPNTDTVEGHSTKLLDVAPAEESRYSKVRAWVDQATCLPLKVEFYEGDKVTKELTTPMSSPQKSGDYWYLSEVHMRDLKDGTGTVLRVSGVSGHKELPSSNFDPGSFYLK